MAAPDIRWDTDTAAVSVVLAALAFLVLVRRGFRPRISL